MKLILLNFFSPFSSYFIVYSIHIIFIKRMFLNVYIYIYIYIRNNINIFFGTINISRIMNFYTIMSFGENGGERSKIKTLKMASILIENVMKCIQILMFMITN